MYKNIEVGKFLRLPNKLEQYIIFPFRIHLNHNKCMQVKMNRSYPLIKMFNVLHNT